MFAEEDESIENVERRLIDITHSDEKRVHESKIFDDLTGGDSKQEEEISVDNRSKEIKPPVSNGERKDVGAVTDNELQVIKGEFVNLRKVAFRCFCAFVNSTEDVEQLKDVLYQNFSRRDGSNSLVYSFCLRSIFEQNKMEYHKSEFKSNHLDALSSLTLTLFQNLSN